MKLPDKLNRKAIIKIFDQISPSSWEKLFEREDQNGIGKFRCDGDFPSRAYYDTNALKAWLVRNGRCEVRQRLTPKSLRITTHLMV